MQGSGLREPTLAKMFSDVFRHLGRRLVHWKTSLSWRRSNNDRSATAKKTAAKNGALNGSAALQNGDAKISTVFPVVENGDLFASGGVIGVPGVGDVEPPVVKSSLLCFGKKGGGKGPPLAEENILEII